MDLPKRRHTTLNLQQKAEILEKLEHGVSGKILAGQYKVGQSTISDIRRSKEKILKFTSKYSSGFVNRKTFKRPAYPEMEKYLFQWFLQQRTNQIMINDFCLCEKSKEVFKEIYPDKDPFHASHGWLQKFKQRYSIKFYKNIGLDLQGQFNMNIDHEEENNLDTTKNEQIDCTLFLEENNSHVSHESAVESFDICLKWAQENDINILGVSILEQLKSIASGECLKNRLTD